MGPSDVLIVLGARPARAAVLVCVVLVLGSGCGRNRPAAQNATSDTGLDDGSITISEGSPLRGKLKLETVESRPVRSRLLAPASVEADPARMARIVPPLAGQVKQLFVRQGELVTKGQPLFVLDAPDLVTARADFLRAKSVLVQAENALRRQQDLFEHAIAAKQASADATAGLPAIRSLGLTLSMPLPFSKLSRADLEGARAAASQAETQVQAARKRVDVEVRQALARYEAARKSVAIYAGGILANADHALEATRYSYERGAARLIEVLDAQRTVDDVYLGYAGALADRARALVTLQRAAAIWDVDF
jgi:multidrug efflux pump subunit AcrA (membrane-fusion protein)